MASVKSFVFESLSSTTAKVREACRTLCCRKQFTDLREGHVDEGLDKMQSSLVEAVS